ncbi:putative secreted protein [Corynebacterium deserti GIMN1.010]|uniref:Putative secreted protein n=1 Tax=Corynebacterium deserti GIMN1.010 TaxID=931089 RepID=A0A0M4CCB8_9CORY|nr:hypothetical protein [Corynebacterium deserti]ALC04841.1 putative secreted protein [Corynebacterium deserti GIMN1.010]
MNTFARKIVTFALAGALITPTTVGIADAQSSFGSSSAGGGSTNGGGNNNNGSKADRLEREFERVINTHGAELGISVNSTEDARADVLLQRALNNELTFQPNNSDSEFFIEGDIYSNFSIGYDTVSGEIVVRTTEAEIDRLLAGNAIETLFLETEVDEEQPLTNFGISVGRNSENFFVAIVSTVQAPLWDPST